MNAPPDDGGLRLGHLEVPRTARFACQGGGGKSIEQLWYVLHGYGQSALDFIRPFRVIQSPERMVVAPEALSRFYQAPGNRRHGEEDPVGASWMTREDREAEIRDYVRYLDRLQGVVEGGKGLTSEATSRIVLGFSQGGHTAARWVFMGGVRPHRLVLWGADLPEDLPLEERGSILRGCGVTFVRGREDPRRDPDREALDEARLEGLAIPVEVRTHGGGHRLSRAVLKELV